jgi:hypothetical protein
MNSTQEQNHLMNGCLVLMLNSAEILSQIRKSNVGVSQLQLTSHGDVLMKVKNASVKVDILPTPPNLTLTRKSSDSLMLLSYLLLLSQLKERDHSLVQHQALMVLIQLQMLIRHASVMLENNSLNHLS